MGPGGVEWYDGDGDRRQKMLFALLPVLSDKPLLLADL